MKTSFTWVGFLVLLLGGCSDSHGRFDDAGPGYDAGPRADAGPDYDAGPRPDAGPGSDAGAGSDAGPGCDMPVPTRHRASGAMCPMDRAAPPILGMYEPWWECGSHDECTDGINGRCTGSEFHGYRCTYDTCFDDSACEAGPCSCRGATGGVGSGGQNHCTAGNCQTDSDCGPRGYCSPSQGSCGEYGGTVGYYCHTCEDECTDDADCGGYPSHCDFNEVAGRWQCEEGQCAG